MSIVSPTLEQDGEHSARARRLLARYVAGGPGDEASPAAWARWRKANRGFLFFGEIGGYRWYVDPLAKLRGVPTAGLRGLARASR